jgi:hypothetical protein
MPTPRPFITYRDLYDRRPGAEEMHKLLRGLNSFNTVLLLTRLNTMFRHASVSPVKQDSTSFQMFFGQHFLDEETLQRLQQRFGTQNAVYRPLFQSRIGMSADERGEQRSLTRHCNFW